MLEWVWNNKEWIFSGIGLAIFAAIGSSIVRFLKKNRKRHPVKHGARGAPGGNAEIIMGDGEAYGGKGGKGGGLFGPGGKGGDARIVGGGGKAVGGAGGDGA